MKMGKKQRVCPACHGRGGEVDVILDDGTGPWVECGFCEGTGQVIGNYFYQVLGWLSWEKRLTRYDSVLK